MASQARRLTRTTLGPSFSEGARLLWGVLLRRGLSQVDLAAMLRDPNGVPVKQSTVNRWLYGERRPSLGIVVQFADLFRIPARAWSLKPSRRFVLPAAKDLVRKAA